MGIKKFIGDKAFYKSVIAIVLPIVLQNGLNNLVNLLDNVMVGALGTEQMSGTAIVNQLIFIYVLCIFGGTAGAGIFTAQYHGSKNQEGIRYTVRFKIYISAVTALVIGLILAFFSTPLINLFLHDGSESGDLELALFYAQQYLKIVIFAQIPNTITIIYASTLRETGETVMPMVASICSVAVNVLLNYLLIFGKLGLPALGVEGAAIATVIARCVECAVIVIYTHTHLNRFVFFKHLFSSLKIPKEICIKLVKKGASLMFNEALWSISQTLLLYCYSIRGLAVVAAMNINITFSNLFSIVFMSLGSAIGIMVGNLLGAGEIEKARDTDNKIMALSLASCIILGGLMAAFSPLLVHLYKTTDEVKALAVSMLLICSAFMPVHSLVHNSYFTLRSGGKALLTFLFDSFFAAFVSVPIAYVLANFTQMNAVVIYACVLSVDIIKAVIGLILIKKGVWLNNLVKQQTDPLNA